MPLLQANAVQYWIADRHILQNVSLTLDPGSRIALSGANGNGKSTLLKLLCGYLEPNGGSIFKDPHAEVGFLPQSGLVHHGKTLWEEAETAFAPYHEFHDQWEAVGQKIGTLGEQLLSIPESQRPAIEGSLEQLTTEQHHLQELLESGGYYRRDREIEIILKGLGFSSGDFTAPCETFSGGWQMRIALAKILLASPQVLLLDEPTNYLDLEAREWLQSYLQNYSGAVLMVSHDRFFLDQTVQAVAELYLGTLSLYRGSYSAYEKRRSAELEQLVKDYERQQQEIQRIEDFISRFRYNASKAAMVQSRIKSLEKINRIEIPEGLKRIHVSFPEAPRSGDITLRLTDLRKEYPNNPIFDSLSLEFLRGQKVALVGRNGSGKSTLMRIMSGKDRDYGGTMNYGAEVFPAYFAQEAETQLTMTNTVFEEVEEAAPTDMIPKLRGLLGAFLFRGDDIYKPISVLSGGEKNRVSLVKMLLSPANLLLLDEPTNHLDMASKDVLLEALQAFSGTVIFVSHDHFFIQELANRVIEVESPATPGVRRVRDFPGNYSYYKYRIAQESSPTDSSGNPGTNTASTPYPDQTSLGKKDHGDQKQLRAAKRRLERQEEELLSKMEELEQEKSRIEHEMAIPEHYTDGKKISALQTALEDVTRDIQITLESWERVSLEKESLPQE